MSDYTWQCTRCGHMGDTGCDMPDYRVVVPRDDGTITMVRPACPLKPVRVRRSFFQRIKDLLRP